MEKQIEAHLERIGLAIIERVPTHHSIVEYTVYNAVEQRNTTVLVQIAPNQTYKIYAEVE